MLAASRLRERQLPATYLGSREKRLMAVLDWRRCPQAVTIDKALTASLRYYLSARHMFMLLSPSVS